MINDWHQNLSVGLCRYSLHRQEYWKSGSHCFSFSSCRASSKFGLCTVKRVWKQNLQISDAVNIFLVPLNHWILTGLLAEIEMNKRAECANLQNEPWVVIYASHKQLPSCYFTSSILRFHYLTDIGKSATFHSFSNLQCLLVQSLGVWIRRCHLKQAIVRESHVVHN